MNSTSIPIQAITPTRMMMLRGVTRPRRGASSTTAAGGGLARPLSLARIMFWYSLIDRLGCGRRPHDGLRRLCGRRRNLDGLANGLIARARENNHDVDATILGPVLRRIVREQRVVLTVIAERQTFVGQLSFTRQRSKNRERTGIADIPVIAIVGIGRSWSQVIRMGDDLDGVLDLAQRWSNLLHELLGARLELLRAGQ